MTLAERLLRKLYRREIWHEPDGTMDVACDADDPGAEAYYANPDGPEAAARIKELEEALESVLDVSPDKDEVELLPCPFCSTVLSPYTTHRSQEQMWKHPLSGCVLSCLTVAPEETAAWNTRAALGETK